MLPIEQKPMLDYAKPSTPNDSRRARRLLVLALGGLWIIIVTAPWFLPFLSQIISPINDQI